MLENSRLHIDNKNNEKNILLTRTLGQYLCKDSVLLTQIHTTSCMNRENHRCGNASKIKHLANIRSDTKVRYSKIQFKL